MSNARRAEAAAAQELKEGEVFFSALWMVGAIERGHLEEGLPPEWLPSREHLDY